MPHDLSCKEIQLQICKSAVYYPWWLELVLYKRRFTEIKCGNNPLKTELGIPEALFHMTRTCITLLTQHSIVIVTVGGRFKSNKVRLGCFDNFRIVPTNGPEWV